MSLSIAPVESPTTFDPRLAAFLDPNSPEVFHSVATPTSIWMADPYDVEAIHTEARAAFESLLNRGNRPSPAPSGAVLVLLGEAGSGKTHLMRAFRTRAHQQGLGYCGYLQMTAEASNYARYMLTNMVDSLEQPYNPSGHSRTGLGRLSGALLELIPGLSQDELQTFRSGEIDCSQLVDDYADRLHELPKFRDCDIELLRILLHLERNVPQVRSRALMWLRCQSMRTQDRAWIGDAAARTDDADPMRMLQQLARVVDSVHGVPLVILIDQLEDMANQSAPIERFKQVVDAIVAFTDTISNAIVVLACLEDYYKANIEKLTRSKCDRLDRDPEPIRLSNSRTLDEIHQMAAKRLGYLFDSAGVGADDDALFPFKPEQLGKLSNMRSRDILDMLRRHHQRCVSAGRWEEPHELRTSPDKPPVSLPLAESQLDPLWNDFHSSYDAIVPDSEEELARVVADAVRASSLELPACYQFDCSEPRQRYVEVATCMPDNSVDKVLVAICNGKAGPGLIKQVTDLEQTAGEIPVAVVRTTDFPKSGKAVEQIAKLLKRDGRKIVVADADWRRMLAFEAFRKLHSVRADFTPWQRSARPLGELDSLQRILRLQAIHAAPKLEINPPVPVPTPIRQEVPSPVLDVPKPAAPLATETLLLGMTQGLTPTTVTFDPKEFVQHAAFIGGSGSGKTTAALNLIEQLLARGIPAVLLDRKGDLCRYGSQAAWQETLSDPKRAATGQALLDKLDVAVYTPGEPHGRPLALPIVPPGFDQLPEADRERFALYAAAALGSMIGFKTSDGDRGQLAILAKAIETIAAVPAASITIPILRHVIEQQDDALLNAIGGGYPDKYYSSLAQRLLTLQLNNRQLLAGDELLDVDALLGTGAHARPGRVRLSVISTRFLGDPAKIDFWVSQLLVAVSRWCAKSPQPRLQAVFLFDEADQYLPAVRQPATKAPMEDLLKRARSAGVGIFLATQSPGDFDYKCKENVRTWLLGRVKEPRALDKLRPMLAAAKGNVLDKLPAQGTGEFFLVRESNVTAVRSNPSLMRTDQLAEDEIAEVARECIR
jgi:hypothetical protein